MKYIRIIYLISCFAAFVMCLGFFYVWNGDYYSAPKIANTRSSWDIDTCNIGEDVIEVKGWAYIPSTGRVLNHVFAEVAGGKLISIPSTSFHLADVQKNLSLTDYEMPGFHAIKRNLHNIDLTGTVIIVSESESGRRGVAKVNCKK